MVNGVAGLENRPQMAFIPTGTTNDYARALKIPMGDPVAAARIIEKNQTIQMDIGRAYGSKVFHQHCCSRNHDRIDLQCSK